MQNCDSKIKFFPNILTKFYYLLFLTFFTLLLLPSISDAQITFERTYGGTSMDEGYSVRQTTDGGYIITGHTKSFGDTLTDIYLIKTDSLGDTLWTRTYGGNDWDYGRSVWQTSDGGYIVAGWTFSFGAGEPDIYIIKTDSSGDTLWTRIYGGTSGDWSLSVQQITDGGYIIGGAIDPFGADPRDFYLIKLDSLGNSLWTRTYGDTSYNVGFFVQQTSDEGFIFVGVTTPFGESHLDIYLIKTDSLGDTLWTKTYGGSENDRSHCVQQTSDGGYIIAGYTSSFGAGWTDVYLIKTNSLGEPNWSKTIGDTNVDVVYSVQQTSDGRYIFAGYSNFGAGNDDVYLIKMDAFGDTIWTKTFGGTGRDQGRSVQQTSDGGYIIAGATTSFGAGLGDVYLIKTDGNGMVVGIEEEIPSIEFTPILLQNHPNPFHFHTTIQYHIPMREHVTLRMYDITGKLVEILVDEKKASGLYQISWEGRTQPSGIYFYSLKTSDSVQTKKLIFLK
jgi:hypothetical protein